MELDFSRVRFCGRQGETRQLNKTLDEVRGTPIGGSAYNGGRGNNPGSRGSSSSSRPCHKVVMIEGGGGTGKSKLAEHFLDNVVEKQTLLRYQHEMEDPSMSSSSGSHNAFLPILIGRGKFDESSTMPFASFTECINSLLMDLKIQDPDWSDNLGPDTWREIRRLSSIVPNIREYLGFSREEAESTIFTGNSGMSSDSASGQQWVSFVGSPCYSWLRPFATARIALLSVPFFLCFLDL